MPAPRRFAVSADGCSLLADGRPWVPLGDTAWELFHRLDAAEAAWYLDTRAAQGFDLVLACALSEFDGLRVPDRQGNVPFVDLDSLRPVEAYWRHIDAVIAAADARGLVVGLLPTWGDKWHDAHGAGPVVFGDPAVARAYGAWIGARYRDASVLWVLGGDRAIDTAAQARVVDAMAEGIRAAVGRDRLLTFHPRGDLSSGELVHDRGWLDFNSGQSGHAGWDKPNYELILRDRARVPAKPTLDAEPRYEHHPVMTPDWTGWIAGQRFTDLDVRLACWHAWTAGACGHVYGCHAVWQMHDPARHGDGINNPGLPWREAMRLPGADGQMRVWRDVAVAHLGGEPDDGLLRVWQGAARWRIGCLRASDRTWAVAYVGCRRPVRLDGAALAPPRLAASWLDPRTGAVERIGVFARAELPELLPPASGPDWVLVVDGRVL